MYNLSMKDAWELSYYPCLIEDGDKSSVNLRVKMNRVGVAMNKLMLEAKDMYRDADGFQSTLMDIGTPGSVTKDRPFRFLMDDKIGRKSLERYSRCARIIILIGFRVLQQRSRFSAIPMSPMLKKEMDALYQLLQNEEQEMDTTKKQLHRVLCEVYFEKSSIGRGSSKLFAAVVVACITVVCEHVERYRFRLGNQVSPIIRDILYSASCC